MAPRRRGTRTSSLARKGRRAASGATSSLPGLGRFPGRRARRATRGSASRRRGSGPPSSRRGRPPSSRRGAPGKPPGSGRRGSRPPSSGRGGPPSSGRERPPSSGRGGPPSSGRGGSRPPSSRRGGPPSTTRRGRPPSIGRRTAAVASERRRAPPSSIGRGAATGAPSSSTIIGRGTPSSSATVIRRSVATTFISSVGAFAGMVSHLGTVVALTTVSGTRAITSPVTEFIAVEALHITILSTPSSKTTPLSSPIGTSILDPNFAPVNGLVVQSTNRLLGITLVLHFNKGETRGVSSGPSRDNTPVASESIFDSSNFNIGVQVANIDFDRSAHSRERRIRTGKNKANKQTRLEKRGDRKAKEV